MAERALNIVPACLFEGDYHLGAAVLINSLHRAGFRGTFIAGYRGQLPAWAVAAQRPAGGASALDVDSIKVEFHIVPDGPNLSAAKPPFMLDMLDRIAPQADVIVMFDADIIVTGPWPFFADWAGQGAGLCLDMSYPILPDGHPHRHAWRAMIGQLGLAVRPLDWYFNGGYVSVRRQDRALLEAWRDLLALASKRIGPLVNIKVADRSDPLAVPDQDMLNAAAMATAVPLAPLGTDGMGFTPSGYAMLHAVAGKPWRNRYLKLALAGQPPGAADKAFWSMADRPIKSFSASQIAGKRRALAIASAIGRFYRRGL